MVSWEVGPPLSAPGAGFSQLEVAQVRKVDGQHVAATLSIGLVMVDNAPADIGALLGQADQALYCAKERGRNRVEVASLKLIRERRERISKAEPSVDIAAASSAAA